MVTNVGQANIECCQTFQEVAKVVKCATTYTCYSIIQRKINSPNFDALLVTFDEKL